MVLLILLTQIILSDEPFRQISSVTHINNDIYLVSTVQGDYHAHIYDSTTDEIVESFIRHGGGPEESRGISATTICDDETFVFLSNDGKILHYDQNIDLINEFQIIQMGAESVFCSNGLISFGSTSYFSVDRLSSSESFIVGYTYHLSSGENIREIKLKGTDVFLGKNTQLRNIEIVSVYFYVVHLNTNTSLVFIDGSPVVYVVDNEVSYTVFPNSRLNNLGYNEVFNSNLGLYGQRPSSVNTSLQAIHSYSNTSFKLTFGNHNVDLDYGYTIVEYENGALNLSSVFEDDSFQEEIRELGSRFNIVYGTSTKILYGQSPSFANYLYIYGE